jgi:hypothetical protein
MQHTSGLPTGKRSISRTGVCQGLIARQLNHRIQARVDGRDPLQVGLDNRF